METNPIKIRDNLNKLIFILRTRQGEWKDQATTLANDIMSDMKNTMQTNTERAFFTILDGVVNSIIQREEDPDGYIEYADDLERWGEKIFRSPVTNTKYSMRYSKPKRSRKARKSVKRSRKTKKSVKRSRKTKKSVKRSRKVKRSIKRSRKAKKSVRRSKKTTRRSRR